MANINLVGKTAFTQILGVSNDLDCTAIGTDEGFMLSVKLGNSTSVLRLANKPEPKLFRSLVSLTLFLKEECNRTFFNVDASEWSGETGATWRSYNRKKKQSELNLSAA